MESTKVPTDTNKQLTFSMETGDYKSGRADKNKGSCIRGGQSNDRYNDGT
jgi:hypothetical protein